MIRPAANFVGVPVIQKRPKIVEVPEVREITKFVENVKIIDVPIERVKIVPKLDIREVEKIRHVPGPIEYIDIEQEFIVAKPYTEIIEHIREIPEIEDVNVEVPYYVPTPVGPPEERYINVPLPYDVPHIRYIPDHKPMYPIQQSTYHKINKAPNFYVGEKEYTTNLQNFDYSNTQHNKREDFNRNRTDRQYNQANEYTRHKRDNEYYEKNGDRNRNNVQYYDMYNDDHDSYIVNDDFQNSSEHNQNNTYNEDDMCYDNNNNANDYQYNDKTLSDEYIDDHNRRSSRNSTINKGDVAEIIVKKRSK